MIVVVLAGDGEVNCNIALTAWKGTGTPATSYPMREVRPGVYESSDTGRTTSVDVAGLNSVLVGDFQVSMTNGSGELVYVGYVHFDGGARGQADDNPVSLAPPVVTTPPTSTGDIDSRIAEIDVILASGATSVSVDGTTTGYNLEQLRKERLELLKRKESGTTTGQRRRPYFTRPKLG